MTTHVADCSVTNCSFNDHTNCNAEAITVGGMTDHASCATFIDTGIRGGCRRSWPGWVPASVPNASITTI